MHKRKKTNVYKTEAVVQRCSVKKLLLKNSHNSQKNTCARISFLIKLQASACTFIKKETLAQVFSCEFFENFKNTLWLLLYKKYIFHTISSRKIFRISQSCFRDWKNKFIAGKKRNTFAFFAVNRQLDIALNECQIDIS